MNVQITVDGVDITTSVIFASARFEQQMNAMPGTCSFQVKDPDQTFSFTTGDEIRLYVDGDPMWGGYLRRKRMGYPFPADDTSSAATYENRIWTLDGADYNILWDNLILRRESNYVSHLPDNTGYDKTTMDGWAFWKMLQGFSDFPSGFNITSTRADADTIDDIKTVLPSSSTRNFFYKTQSTKLRDQAEEFAKMAGAVYYISADKKVHYHAYESVVKRWGFSDEPNRVALTVSPSDYQNSDWGFHEVEAEEDGTMMINDALIWGGSPIGSDGDVLFARYQDEVGTTSSTSTTYVQSGAVVSGSSIYTHGRWQVGEIHTEGGMYGNLDGVKARANVIINGPAGTSAKGETKGLRFPMWQFTFNWRAWQVPTLSGSPDHIIAGDIVRIELAAFGVAQFAPCRSMRIEFANLDPEGDAYVVFQGDFNYSYTDPTTLWKAILNADKSASTSTNVQITSSTNDSASTSYGSFGQFTPVESPNGSLLVFTLPNGFGYLPGSLDVYLNGLIQRSGTDFNETNPAGGTFTFTSAPVSTDTVQVVCRTTAT